MKIVITLIMMIAFSALAATDPQKAWSMVKEGKAVLVDVREKDEIKSGMIDKAEWFPESKTRQDKNWTADFKKIAEGKKVFLYCRSGRRSGNMAKDLEKSGLEAESIGGFEELKSMLPSHIPKGL